MVASVKRAHKGPLRDVLARNMRQLPAVHSLSQEALAHESGIDRTYVSSIERTKRGVSIDIVARTAKALGRVVETAEGGVGPDPGLGWVSRDQYIAPFCSARLEKNSATDRAKRPLPRSEIYFPFL